MTMLGQFLLFHRTFKYSFIGRLDGRRYHSNSLRISSISLKFGRWCTVTWSRLLLKVAMLGQHLRVPWNFEIFHDRLGPGLGENVTALTLLVCQLLTGNLLGWYTVAWRRLLFKMAMLSHFFARSTELSNFSNRLGPYPREDITALTL